MSLEQKPFADPSLFENPERRCPVVLLLDTSYSMSGAPIDALNKGVEVPREELLTDPVAAKRVEIEIITFGPVTELTSFTGAESFVAPTLAVSGDTPMGAAIVAGIDRLQDRKEQYKSAGLKYYRPWLMLITDGAPTDDWAAAAKAVHEGEKEGRFSFYAIAVAGADLETLTQIAPPNRPPAQLDQLTFRELFRWLSSSLGAVSSSQPGTSVPIQDPVAAGWGSHG